MTVTETVPPQVSRLGKLDEQARAVLFTAARTANTFADTPVSDDELNEVWELAKWGPSAANVQPMRVLYVRPGEGRDRLVSHLNEGNRAKTASAPAVAVLAVDTQFHQHLPAVLPIKPEIKAYLDADAGARDVMGQFNSAIQVGYFILAVRAAGLAAGPMGGFDKATLDADFFPDGRWKSVLVVNIGHPGKDPWYPRLPRLDHSDVVRWA